MSQMKVILRKARSDDLPRLLELDRMLFAWDSNFDKTLDLGWSGSDEALEFFGERIGGDGVLLVAEVDGRVMGSLCGAMAEPLSYRVPMKLAELETVVVDASARGLGIGTVLARGFREWARGQGADRIQVRVSAGNERAIAFYREHGFLPHDLVMEVELRVKGEG